MSKPVPIRAEGWKFKARVGQYHVWQLGANDYCITDGCNGPEVARKPQFGLAYSSASKQHDARLSMKAGPALAELVHKTVAEKTK